MTSSGAHVKDDSIDTSHGCILYIENVTVSFDGFKALDDLNLYIDDGELRCIIGPNGAGKSSLVKLIDRSLYPIVRPDAHLRLFGSETVNLWALRSRLGVVSSDMEQRLHPKTAVEEAVVSNFFGATRLGRDQKPSARQWDQAREALCSAPAGTDPKFDFGKSHHSIWCRQSECAPEGEFEPTAQCVTVQ